MAHHTTADIMAAAEDLGEGWRKATITLTEGDTADSGTSTKWNLAGPGTVVYYIHPSGWDVRVIDDTVTRSYI